MTVQSTFTVSGSGRDGFSAADIQESKSEESGDDGDLKTAGERRAESAATGRGSGTQTKAFIINLSKSGVLTGLDIINNIKIL